MTYDIVETTTAPLGFQLLENGDPINLTGALVELLLEDKDGNAITDGAVSVVDATTGIIQYQTTIQDTFDSTKGPYLARWRITDQSGNLSYVPSSNRDIWNIIGV